MMLASPINRRLVTLLRCPCHQPRQWYTTSNRKRGRLFFDRDYHIHLGGAIPPAFIANWIRDGHLSLNDEIPDLKAAPSSSSASNTTIPNITVHEAIVKYRGVDARELDARGHAGFLSAYNTPAYTSLPTFLTLYRAYSRRNLLTTNASQIARGHLVHPSADIRISIPHPNETPNHSAAGKESPSNYAKRALEEMKYFDSCLLPTQQLVITFPRQTFNAHKNHDYFVSFIELLKSTMKNNDPSYMPWLTSSHNNNLAFDFAGQPLPLDETLPLLHKLRNTFPSAFICYHHGELCPIPFSERVRDTMRLLPYVNRVGHGLCLGLAVLGINPDDDPCSSESTTDSNVPLEAKEEVVERNRDVAYRCLHQMAELDIGIEVSPTCNISLGGAQSEQVLRRYVNEFLDAGVDIFVGTDDPGFLGTCLEKEVAILNKESR